jgi:penicillin-binding protein 1A
LTTGIWFGNDDNKPTRHMSGSTLPTEAWKKFMSAALDGMQVAALPGNYRYQAPGNYALAGQGSQVATLGEDGRPIVLQPGQQADPIGALSQSYDDDDPDDNLPTPPAGMGSGRTDRHRSFLQRLFGG